MRNITAMLLLAAAIPATSFAQRPQNGNYDPRRNYRYDNMQYDNSVLSIFSEDGQPFFLVINGIKQNMIPQSKMRVESLPKYMNDVQVMFANGGAPIHQQVNIADPINGKAVNLTLRISRNRQGYPTLKFHRMTECDRNYHGPRDEYVMYYGKPQQINTTTETSYIDPITGQWITETTTTTTDNYNNNYNNYNNHNNNYTPPPPPPPVRREMDARTFNDVKMSISRSSFDDTKLSTARTALAANNVSTNQVMELCKLFSFEENKLSFAQFAYDKCVDPQNYFKVASIFSFDSNKQSLNDLISSNPR